MVKDVTSKGGVRGGGRAGGVTPKKTTAQKTEAKKKVVVQENDRWVRPQRKRRNRGDARAQMRKMAVTSGLAAAVNRTVRSSGSDYSHSRHYAQGDDAKRLDWKAIAKTDKLHTKIFTEDPSPCVLMVIPSDIWKKTNIAERERRRGLEQVAALMAFSSEHHKTPFGVMVYSDQTDLFAVASGDPGTSDMVLDQLAELESRDKDAKSQEHNLVGGELSQLRGRKAIILYCTDRPDDEIPEDIRGLGKNHDVLRISIAPDRISTAAPAMLQIHGQALSDGGDGVKKRIQKNEGTYDELAFSIDNRLTATTCRRSRST